MITITFQAKDIADLKLQIQEYSLAHLGLNFKAMAEQLMKRPKIAQPGESVERVMGDGTVRLHNPHYPSAMEPDAKRGRGRPVGWRKEKAGASEESVSDSVSPAESTATNSTEAPAPYSKESAKKAIVRLNQVKGYKACLEALQTFGAGHLNELAEDKYQELIELCERKTNEPDPIAE